MRQAGVTAALTEVQVYPKYTQLEGVGVLEGVVEVEVLMQVQAHLVEVEVVMQAVAWSLLLRAAPQALLLCTVMEKLSGRLRAS